MTYTSDKTSRSGFTLSELLVVLGLLVAVTAATQPLLRGALCDSRLRSAAKLVRVELAKARLKAMQSGVAQQFRHELGKSRFEVASAMPSDDEGPGADSSRDRQRTASASESSQGDAGEDVLELSLPEGVCFEEPLEEAAESIAATEDGWSEPIVFYPNGRTASAHFRLKGAGNAYVEVSLRGLTGVATAGKLRHEEELR